MTKTIKSIVLLTGVFMAVISAAYASTYNADWEPMDDGQTIEVVADTMAEQAQADGTAAVELTVTHVYEDGCIDVLDEVSGDIAFYCAAEFE